jgi:hypothetical protein
MDRPAGCGSATQCVVWHSGAVLRERREDGPTPSGGAYSVVRWDDESGDADIFEYDTSGALVCRHEWRMFESARAAVIGEVVTFNPDGLETGRRLLRHAAARDPRLG